MARSKAWKVGGGRPLYPDEAARKIHAALTGAPEEPGERPGRPLYDSISFTVIDAITGQRRANISFDGRATLRSVERALERQGQLHGRKERAPWGAMVVPTHPLVLIARKWNLSAFVDT